MNTRVISIVDEARKLRPDERLDRLHIEFADDEAAESTAEEIEAAWVEEVERHFEQHERGVRWRRLLMKN